MRLVPGMLTDLHRVIPGVGDMDVGGATLVVEKRSHVGAQRTATISVNLHMKHNTHHAQERLHVKQYRSCTGDITRETQYTSCTGDTARETQRRSCTGDTALERQDRSCTADITRVTQ